jgi:hypothetical protein
MPEFLRREAFGPNFVNMLSEYVEQPDELWARVEAYVISNYGLVVVQKDVTRNKWEVVKWYEAHGTYAVQFNRSVVMLPRLVARAFLNNGRLIPQSRSVRHIDGDKRNVHVSNLEIIPKPSSYRPVGNEMMEVYNAHVNARYSNANKTANGETANEH